MNNQILLEMKKTITWVTASYFFDVDCLIVPYLSAKFKIHWIILVNSENDPNIKDITNHINSIDMNVEVYILSGRWYSITQFCKYVRLFHYVRDLKSTMIYIDATLFMFSYYAAFFILPRRNTIFATHNVKVPKGARLEKITQYYMYKLLISFKNFHVFSKNQLEIINLISKNKNVLYAPLVLKNYGPINITNNKPNHKVNFLYFGYIRQYKRIDLLINAAQKLYESGYTNFVVTIAGACSIWNAVYQPLIKYPQLFNLRIGYIPNDEVAKLFGEATFLVLPYQDLAQSGAITVAFNYYTPVITSNISPFLEFVQVGINGYTFQNGDEKSLTEILKRMILMDSNEYNKLKQTTKQFVDETYSLTTIANKYVKYFNAFA